jgi:hypothetical protein
MPRRPPEPDLELLLGSWALALRTERKSPQTVKTYTDGVRCYLRWCDEPDLPRTLDRTQVTSAHSPGWRPCAGLAAHNGGPRGYQVRWLPCGGVWSGGC